jgi:xanthine/CO dehydrogenase XdhC/CoxF family maturation factor
MAQLKPDAYTAVLLMSHDYDKDLLALRHFLPLNPRYLGLLGPRKRMVKLHDDLIAEGLNLEGFSNLYAPTGLDIGAESPEEIAASIVAEVIAVFRNRDGGRLRERSGSIH